MTTELRVLVCGGRYFDDGDLVFATLDKLHAKTPIGAILHGGATGADTLANAWANTRNISREAWVAQWDVFGKAAGPIRNQKMLDEGKPDLIVSFRGGRGTLDMVTRAKKAGIEHVAVP